VQGLDQVVIADGADARSVGTGGRGELKNLGCLKGINLLIQARSAEAVVPRRPSRSFFPACHAGATSNSSLRKCKSGLHPVAKLDFHSCGPS
jgi:hypothetical protein